MAPRVRTLHTDYNRNELPAGFDVVVLSNILHIEGEEANRRLLAKAYRSLHPGGRVAIIDLLMNDDKRGPAGPLEPARPDLAELLASYQEALPYVRGRTSRSEPTELPSAFGRRSCRVF